MFQQNPVSRLKLFLLKLLFCPLSRLAISQCVTKAYSQGLPSLFFAVVPWSGWVGLEVRAVVWVGWGFVLGERAVVRAVWGCATAVVGLERARAKV